MSAPFSDYKTVIGIECHVQLNTQTKLFSYASNHFGDSPNTNLDALCTALPGSLPVLSEQAVSDAIKLGLALGCQINKTSVFARKHYFYPDLPKGYQISQFDKPIIGPGVLNIQVGDKVKPIRIHRIHIEEDAGKNIHVEGGKSSYVDYNRAGTPLLEVVTEPDIESAEEAIAFFKGLRNLVMYLEICDGNLQEGSMRADINVSVMKNDAAELGTRTETKNMNSFKFIGQAIEYETRRQILDLEDGKKINQETRLWDANLKESRAMRSKEEANDYRYFPDPDLPSLILENSRIENIKLNLPETPAQKLTRYKTLGLSDYNANILTADKDLCDYFETALSTHNNAKLISNWIINEVLRLNKASQQSSDSNSEYSNFSSPISANKIGELVKLIDTEVISGKTAKKIFELLAENPSQSPLEITEKNNWKLEKDNGLLEEILNQVIKNNPDEVEKFKSGKQQVFGFLMGQVMKLSRGKVSPKDASAELRKKLSA